MEKNEKFRLGKIAYLNTFVGILVILVVLMNVWLLFTPLNEVKLALATKYVETISGLILAPTFTIWLYEIHCLMVKKRKAKKDNPE